MKINLSEEQSLIREEILNATKRSNLIEQKFQEEREQLLAHIRKLEASVEDMTNTLNLTRRELEYKDALLSQTFRSPKPVIPTQYEEAKVRTVYAGNTYQDYEQMLSSPEYPGELEQIDLKMPSREQPPSNQKGIGGIWSKLSS